MTSPTSACVTSGENVFPPFPTSIVCVAGPLVLFVAIVEDPPVAEAEAALEVIEDAADDADCAETVAASANMVTFARIADSGIATEGN